MLLICGGENVRANPVVEPPSTCLLETDVTEWMVEALVNAFHRRLSHHAYQVTEGGWGEGAQSGIALDYDMTVTLRLPLARLDNPVVRLTGVNVSTRINNG
jgi:hypothetical protein